MAVDSDRTRRDARAPLLESLEQRLMLTAVEAGEVFVYFNSQEQIVRVSIENGTMELLAHDDDLGITNMPGMLFGGGPPQFINWDDGESAFEVDEDSGEIEDFLAYDPDGDPGFQRGGETEIWAIYVSEYSEDTLITVALLDSSPFDQDFDITAVTPYGGDEPMVTRYVSDNDETIVTTPDGSGGALVGGEFWEIGGDNADDRRYRAVSSILDEANPDPVTGIAPPFTINGNDFDEIPDEADFEIAPGITFAENGGVDMGTVRVGGTVAGIVRSPNTLDLFDVGFLYGSMDVDKNLNTVNLLYGGGAVRFEIEGFGGGTRYDSPNDSLIDVQGAFRELNVFNGTLYTAVQVAGDPTLELPDYDAATDRYIFSERETKRHPVTLESSWLAGVLADTVGDDALYSNDVMHRADFLTHPSGDFWFSGRLQGTNTGGAPIDIVDYLALPIMAGETVTISGSLSEDVRVRLMDRDGIVMDSYGFETIQDRGIGRDTSALKPLVFTAPAAGVYYLQMTSDLPDQSGTYLLHIEGAGDAHLGAVRVLGNHDGREVLGSNVGGAIVPGHFGTGTANDANIAVKSGANLGAVFVFGPDGDTDVGNTWNTVVRAQGGGDLVVFQASSVGPHHRDPEISGNRRTNTITSEGPIGFVGALRGDPPTTAPESQEVLAAYIEAGYGSGFFDFDADLQNVFAANVLAAETTLAATGSIGVVEVMGLAEGFTLSANTDGVMNPGPPGHVDLILVHGDWGAPDASIGVPTLRHGPGGDIGYIHVGGTIHVRDGAFPSVQQPVVVTDGRTIQLNDDGGGQLTIRPQPTPIPIDDEDDPETFFTPVVEYFIIGVDDAFGGVGGVIANLFIEGSASLSVTGTVQISTLNVAPLAGLDDPVDVQVGASGSGTLDVYHLHTRDRDGSLRHITHFRNQTTDGDLVSGRILDADSIRTSGSLGAQSGRTGAWVPGPEIAPTSADITVEPQFGWFHNTVNGLWADGPDGIGELWVGGSLGDVRAIGELTDVRVNSDSDTPAGEWDGVNGLVWSNTRIGRIDVGDGLADDGGGERVQAAIISTAGDPTQGSIGTVYIRGPRRVVDGRVFGELNGSILASNDWNVIEQDEDGNDVIVGTLPAINRVIGVDGASLRGIVAAGEADWWLITKGGFSRGGGIGTVDFSGAGAVIDGAEISGAYVGTVRTSADSSGIRNSYINADGGSIVPDGVEVINTVFAGGAGMFNTTVAANGGGIGTVRGVGPTADILFSDFIAVGGMQLLQGRDLIGNAVRLPGTLARVVSSRDIIRDTYNVGGLTRLTAGRHFSNSRATVAGEIRSMNIGGGFINSFLTLQGPAVAVLRNLTVAGVDPDDPAVAISGQIISAGWIGNIVAQSGSITADVFTLENETNSDVLLIQTAGGYTGKLSVAGTLRRFVSAVSLGEDPTTTEDGLTQTFTVLGDLERLEIGTRGMTTAHLFANVNVGGDFGLLIINGNFFGRVSVNGDFNRVQVAGTLGGVLPGLGAQGRLEVMGLIQNLQFAQNQSIFADLIVGGGLTRINLQNGNIEGNITSRYGPIDQIKVVNGSINGNVSAPTMGVVRVINGSVNGDLTVTRGHLNLLYINGGNLTGGVAVENGALQRVRLTGTATASASIFSQGDVLQALITGNYAGTLISERAILSVTVRGTLTGLISAETYIRSATIVTGLSGATVRAGTGIGRIIVNGSVINGSIISSGWDIDLARIAGSVADAYILAGYDVGPGGTFGGGDDVLHSGDISRLIILGTIGRSVVVAGVGPGDTSGGVRSGFLATGDNPVADGVSSISRVNLRGGVAGDPTEVGFLADTTVDSRLTDSLPAGVVVSQGTENPGPGTTFGPDLGITSFVSGTLEFRMRGAGSATWVPASNTLAIYNTTSRTVLEIVGNGPAVQVVNVLSADDAALNRLMTRGPVQLGTTWIDGPVNRLQTGDASATNWSFPGGVKQAMVGALTNVGVQAGRVTRWVMDRLTGGQMTVDEVNVLQSGGEVTGNFTSRRGDATRITTGGEWGGTTSILGTVRAMVSGGAVTGDLSVSNGDLYTLKAPSVSGDVHVLRGESRTVNVTGTVSGTYNSANDIRRFSSGSFTGLLNSGGDIFRLIVSGLFSGRGRSAGMVRNARMGSMNNGVLAAGQDVLVVTVNGDVNESFIVAGFDPGFDRTAADASNIQFDAVSRAAGVPVIADKAQGGVVRRVIIRGAMDESAVAAGVDPGEDGYFGTHDDEARGVGVVQLVRVDGNITGSNNAVEAYGVYAASEMPTVQSFRQPFLQNGNARVGTLRSSAGPPTITDVRNRARTVEVYFDHSMNFGTINTQFKDDTKPTTFTLIASNNPVFGDADDVNISDTIDHTLTYTAADNLVTLRLIGHTWETLGQTLYPGLTGGIWLQLTVDGSTVQDTRGNLLDGEARDVFPTGNGIPGGDFVQEWRYGRHSLEADVPAYEWWFGCAPTAAGMLVGYYDSLTVGGTKPWEDLIAGEGNPPGQDPTADPPVTAQVLNPAINQVIASSGDGAYESDSTGVEVISAATPGTGHIGDYALYDEVDDSNFSSPHPDLSEIDPAAAHADDSLADFMGTSRSALGLVLGETLPADIGPGVEDFFAFRGYDADSEFFNFGRFGFSFNTLITEIAAGRPVLLGVDTSANGAADHCVTAVGYDITTGEYGFYNTWDTDAVQWEPFREASPGQAWGISDGILVTPTV